MPDISGILQTTSLAVNQIVTDPFTPLYIILGLLIILSLLILNKMNFKKLLEQYDLWLAQERKEKGFVKFYSLLVILIICIVVILIIFTTTFVVSFGKTQTSALNDYFSIQYEKEIKPQSESEITRIVDEVRPISNLSEKLERIAEWETQNFTDIFWHHSAMKQINPIGSSYYYDISTGKIRAVRSYVETPYAEDPYWITYHRFGACGEESSLFANVSNRAGVVTRPIVLDLGYWIKDLIPVQTGNHVFQEVQAEDGEWYYFDPTIYGADHFLNESPCKDNKPCDPRWFGKMEDYSYFASSQVLRVYRGDTKEDVSDRYTKMSENIRKSKWFFGKRESVNIAPYTIPEIFSKCNLKISESNSCIELP